jgi:hypothetical protein
MVGRLRAPLGATLLAYAGARVKLTSVLDQATFQGGIAAGRDPGAGVDARAVVSEGADRTTLTWSVAGSPTAPSSARLARGAADADEHDEARPSSARASASCSDNSAEAAAQLTNLGLSISGCSDAAVSSSCDADLYGPLLKQLCPVACNSCALAAGCYEDDFAAMSVLRAVGVYVTGCQDPMTTPYCEESSSGSRTSVSARATVGSSIRTLCRSTCAVNGCSPIIEEEDDDVDVTFGGDAHSHDDPHVMNLAGERFSINQPAHRHSLLRVPPDPGVPPLLELGATVAAESASGTGACKLYMTRMAIWGKWLEGSTIEVQPLKRNRAGSNGAGNATVRNFSVRVNHDSAWKSFGDIATLEGQSIPVSKKVTLTAKRREEYGRGSESQAFVVSVEGSGGAPAAITVSQASHQALNIDMAHMVGLGMTNLGGLLGTQRHDPKVEKRTDECNAAVAEARQMQADGPSPRKPSAMASSMFGGRKKSFRYTAKWQ